MNSIWTEVANEALSMVRQRFLTDINDEDDELAEKCRVLIPIVSKQVLELRKWKSATKRIHVVSDGDRPIGPSNLLFQAPEDMIIPVLIFPVMEGENNIWQYGQNPLTDWTCEGRVFHLGVDERRGSDTIALIYVSNDEEQVGKWTAGLRLLISLRLASRLGVSTAGNVKFADYHDGLFEKEFNRACRTDTHNSGAYYDRYSNEDEGAEIYTYSQLASQSFSVAKTGVGYSQIP